MMKIIKQWKLLWLFIMGINTMYYSENTEKSQNKIMDKMKQSFQNVGNKIKEGTSVTGEKMTQLGKATSEKTKELGFAIKDGTTKAGEKIVQVAKNTGESTKKLWETTKEKMQSSSQPKNISEVNNEKINTKVDSQNTIKNEKNSTQNTKSQNSTGQSVAMIAGGATATIALSRVLSDDKSNDKSSSIVNNNNPYNSHNNGLLKQPQKTFKQSEMQGNMTTSLQDNNANLKYNNVTKIDNTQKFLPGMQKQDKNQLITPKDNFANNKNSVNQPITAKKDLLNNDLKNNPSAMKYKNEKPPLAPLSDKDKKNQLKSQINKQDSDSSSSDSDDDKKKKYTPIKPSTAINSNVPLNFNKKNNESSINTSEIINKQIVKDYDKKHKQEDLSLSLLSN